MVAGKYREVRSVHAGIAGDSSKTGHVGPGAASFTKYTRCSTTKLCKEVTCMRSLVTSIPAGFIHTAASE